jgi:alkanesulfonate monooxygenase SsuD/methylene tetrahydromethanopterin reductase-like flavin-dependent oxidoreductase (luciferase family)
MLFGAGIFATDYAIRTDDLGRELEARGFESLWLPEHTHIPVSRRTPYPAGGDLPKEYCHHDPRGFDCRCYSYLSFVSPPASA